MAEPMRYWLKLNDQSIVRFDQPLNPGFVFWLRRKYRAKVVSDGGERVTLTRREPFSEKELQDIYWETEHRQHFVSKSFLKKKHRFDFNPPTPSTINILCFYQSQYMSSKAFLPL
ncbi:U exon protein [Aviadenovirus phalacrocoracidae]|uniref:U exon protein n=1 Tax=Aviadenovirus sp. TaxID=2217649 RepID=A0ABZ0T1L8_9ADEN|nr:U exon protein [Aviadenovirus sp.]